MDRRQVWSDIVRAIAVLWILVSPWILMHVSVHPVLPLQMTGVALLNFFVVGVALIVISVVPSGPSPKEWRSWANAALGVWLIISPFILGFQDSVLIWNAVIAGTIVVATSGWGRRNTEPGAGAA